MRGLGDRALDVAVARHVARHDERLWMAGRDNALRKTIKQVGAARRQCQLRSGLTELPCERFADA